MADGFAEDAVSKKREIKAEPGEDADSDVDGGVLTVSPKTIAKTLTFEATDSKLVPVFDQEALQEAVLEANKDIGKPAQDAGFTIQDGKPEAAPSGTGLGVA